MKTLPFGSVKVVFTSPNWTGSSVGFNGSNAKWTTSPKIPHHHSCTPVSLPPLTHWRGTVGGGGQIFNAIWIRNGFHAAKETVGLKHREMFCKERISSADLRFWRKRAPNEAWSLRAPSSTGSFAGQTLRGRGSEPQSEIIHGKEVHSDGTRAVPAPCTFASNWLFHEELYPSTLKELVRNGLWWEKRDVNYIPLHEALSVWMQCTTHV